MFVGEHIIDGITNIPPNTDTCACCAATSGTDQGWMQIDLKKQYPISRIIITGRGDGMSFSL